MDIVQARRWTRQEYDRMIEAGILTSNDRVELVDGEILAMTPQGSAHATAVVLIQEALRAAIGPDFHLRVQLPLALGAESEPEPDLAIVAGSPRDYRDAHPTAAPLVVEVAEATVAYDRDVKGSLYARAGIQEFWLVNLTEKLVPSSHTHRRRRSPPLSPTAGKGTSQVKIYRPLRALHRSLDPRAHRVARGAAVDHGSSTGTAVCCRTGCAASAATPST